MVKIKKCLKDNGFFILVFLISLLTLILYCINKNTYNVDESLSYALSNFDMGWLDYPSNGILTRYQMDGYRATNNLFTYEMVWHWQALDEHPPLYYALLHTICSVTPGLLSKWNGLIINIFFYGLIIVYLYRTMNELSDNRKLNAVICLLYGIAPVVLQYTIVIRMYVMLSFTFILLVCGSIRLIKSGAKKYLLMILISVVLGGLTNYFYYVFLAIFCLSMLCFFIGLRLDKRLLWLSVGTVILGIIVNLVIFPYVLDLFFQERNSALIAFANVESHFININRVISFLKLAPFGYIGTVLVVSGCVIVMIFAFVRKTWTLNDGFVFSLIMTFICYFLFISTMAFDVGYRFISPIDSLLFITITYVINRISTILVDRKIRFTFTAIIVFSCFVLTGLPQFTVSLYKPLEFAKDHIGSNLIVATPKGTHHYEIDRIFMERDLYGFVFNTDLSDQAYLISDDLYWMNEAVIYVHQDFDESALTTWLNQKTGLNHIEDTGLRSYEYKIYIAS